jgi:hypothetical protein
MPMTHGGRASLVRHSERQAEIAAELRAQAPGLIHSDEATVVVLAGLLCRIELMNEFVYVNGLFDSRGAIRPVARLLASAENSALKAADSLGLNTRARSGLGLQAQGSPLDSYLAEKYGGGNGD